MIPWYHDTTIPWHHDTTTPRCKIRLDIGLFFNVPFYPQGTLKRLHKQNCTAENDTESCYWLSRFIRCIFVIAESCALPMCWQLVGDVVWKIHPLKRCVTKASLRPRRNPNRIGCQSDAAGEKRTARIRGTKTPRKTKAPCLYIFVVLNS